MQKDNEYKKSETITPVLITLLQPSIQKNLSPIILDDKFCEQLSLTGLFSLIQKTDRRWVFDFSDGTGSIKITFSKQYDQDVPLLLKKTPEIDFSKKFYGKVLAMYAPVFNAEKKENDHFLSAFNFIKIEDKNYISFHILETLISKRSRTTGIFSKFEDKCIYDPKKKKENKKEEIITNDENKNVVDEDEDLDKIIINSIKKIQVKTGTGVTFEGLKKFLKGKFDEERLKENLEDLKENGSLYIVPGTLDKYECF